MRIELASKIGLFGYTAIRERCLIVLTLHIDEQADGSHEEGCETVCLLFLL